MLEKNLKNCSENASYISKTSQNNFISCCGAIYYRISCQKDQRESISLNISR